MVLGIVSGDARPYSFDCEIPDGGGGGLVETALPRQPRGGLVETALPNETEPWSAKPTRKRLDHRGPLSIDVSSAWYFITVGGFPGVHVAVLES